MNNMQKAFKKKCGLADGGRPHPNMLGTGMAARAGGLLAGRPQQIEGAIEAPAAAPQAAAQAPAGYGGLSARRDNAMPPAHMLLAQRRGMADGGEPDGLPARGQRTRTHMEGRIKRKAHGGEVDGPGGPTDDEAGVFALSADEYVLPADTVEAMGGAEALDEIRDATHEFVDEKNRPGMANGGEAWEKMKGAAGAAWGKAKGAVSGLRGGQVAAPGAVSNGITNAERVAATPKGYATGGMVQPPSKAMARLATGAKVGGVVAGADQLARGVAGIMEPGDSSAADKIRTGVGAAAFIPGLAPGARAVAGGMSLANMIPDSVYEKGLRVLGLAPAKSNIATPETEAYLRDNPPGKVPAASTQAATTPTAQAPAPAVVAPQAAPPDFGNDRGTGFIINDQTGKRTNIDGRAGLGAARASDPQGGMTQELAGRARQYNTDADALMSKRGGGIGEAFVARGMRNSAKDINAQAMTSQGLDDARENQQLKREGDERVGLAKARTEMAKAQQAQFNADRDFGLRQGADARAGGKQRAGEVQAALEGKLGKQFDKEGNLSPAWANTEAALRNTLQGRTNPDGTPMTIATIPDQELEQLTQTLGLSQKGDLKGWRKTFNWLMGDSKPPTNEIEAMQPAKDSVKESPFGGWTWKDKDGREYFSDELTYDEQIALGIRPERAE